MILFYQALGLLDNVNIPDTPSSRSVVLAVGLSRTVDLMGSTIRIVSLSR